MSELFLMRFVRGTIKYSIPTSTEKISHRLKSVLLY